MITGLSVKDFEGWQRELARFTEDKPLVVPPMLYAELVAAYTARGMSIPASLQSWSERKDAVPNVPR
jgi:hypothetical protein